jgi:hypothetical protein
LVEIRLDDPLVLGEPVFAFARMSAGEGGGVLKCTAIEDEHTRCIAQIGIGCDLKDAGVQKRVPLPACVTVPVPLMS